MTNELNEHESGTYPAPRALTLDPVTLVVYGWTNVEPGTLSWVFPTIDGAMTAVTAMRNAVRWLVIAGETVYQDADVARRDGIVLAESAA